MKTIYLLRSGLGQNQFAIAFECRECAEFQAAWHRREKVPVAIVEVQLFGHIRDALAQACPFVKYSAGSVARPHPGPNAEAHVPVTVNEEPGSGPAPKVKPL